jgi:hypothetical protein
MITSIIVDYLYIRFQNDARIQFRCDLSYPTRIESLTLPQINAAILKFDETKVSTIPENYCTDSKIVNNRLATQRLRRCAFASSSCAVNEIIAAASGLALTK